MLQNTSMTLGFKKIMVYKTPPGGGGKPYLARGLFLKSTCVHIEEFLSNSMSMAKTNHSLTCEWNFLICK